MAATDVLSVASIEPNDGSGGASKTAGEPVIREVKSTKGEPTDVPLKNGNKIKASLGLAYLRALNRLLEKAPDHFQGLLAFAQGRPNDASTESVAYLKDALFLRPDGTIEQGLRDVLISAHQSTAEGSVVVNPFRLETKDQAQTLERMDADSYRWLLRELRNPDENDKGRSIW